MKLLVIVLVIFPGVWSGDWGVTIHNQCFLRGTTAVIRCFYDYPSYHSVKKAVWFKYSNSGRRQDLTSDPFEFVGDFQHNCNLKINRILYAHEGSYYFRFETYWNKWTSKTPAYISVKDVIASVPATVTEGEVVTLTCSSGCDMQRILPSVWFRDRLRVSNIQFKASKEDAGTYSCAHPGQAYVRSAAVSLNVQYAPENVVLRMSPSGDVLLGRPVVFSCSSDANPTVAHGGYSLFKDGHLITYGPEHSISEVLPGDSGQYYCQAGNNITWAGSRLFQSSKTTVDVQYPPVNVSISVDSPEVTEGSVVNLTCHSDANPPASGYTWYRVDSSPSSGVQVGSGPVLSLSPLELSHSGQYMCRTWNQHGDNNSTELLSVQSKLRASAVPVSAGLAVSLLIVLVVVLLLYWKKQKRRPVKPQIPELHEGDSSSADFEMEHIYGNVHMFQTPPTKDDANANGSCPEEVFYTTVSIKPKRPRQKKQTRKIAPEKDDSVIYAAVAKSS